MSNFVCPHCGMSNIDCGKKGYKTPKEIELEQKLEKIKDKLKEVIIKQDNALDTEVTDCDESIDLLYEVSENLEYILQIIEEE